MFVVRLLALLALIFGSVNLWAEIYDSDSELHEHVLSCVGSDPYEVEMPVNLDREMFGKAVSIEELVAILLKYDIESKTAALNYQLPDPLHESEGTRHDLRIAEYFSTTSYAHMAKCAAKHYKEDDEIRSFSNTAIAPSSQKGFVIIRDDQIVVRIITETVYVD